MKKILLLFCALCSVMLVKAQETYPVNGSGDVKPKLRQHILIQSVNEVILCTWCFFNKYKRKKTECRKIQFAHQL